ncbi:MAG: hypothetical protein ACR2QF_15615 [Geminicoccaceae bacterium]
MRVINPNGMVERLNDYRKRPQFGDRYGRRKEGAPRDPKTIKLAAEQDRRNQPREETDPLRGRLFDLTA